MRWSKHLIKIPPGHLPWSIQRKPMHTQEEDANPRLGRGPVTFLLRGDSSNHVLLTQLAVYLQCLVSPAVAQLTFKSYVQCLKGFH